MQAIDVYRGNEQRLEVRIPENKTEEMQDVLTRYLPMFYKKAFRQLGNSADAEDAVQDALLSAFKHLDQFKGQAQMSTWLTSIVTNCARMQLRRRPRLAHVSIDERFGEQQEHAVSDRLPARGPSPEDGYRESELHGHLMQYLAELSPPLRRAFELRDLDELTTSEAAHILGVAEGTVKAQVSRARAKLRRLMRRTLDAQRRPTPVSTVVALVGRKQDKSRAEDERAAVLV